MSCEWIVIHGAGEKLRSWGLLMAWRAVNRSGGRSVSCVGSFFIRRDEMQAVVIKAD